MKHHTHPSCPSSRIAIVLSSLLVCVYWGASANVFAADLGKQYPATLDFSERHTAFDWTCTEQDVWRLSQFSFSVGDKLQIELGPSTVVFGCHETNVLWAVVIPKEAGAITKASDGKGESVTSVWLRFHPARVGELFPADTVVEQGEASFIAQAKAVAAHKMGSSWQNRGRPMIPSRNALAIDMETREGARRFFSVSGADHVEYFDAFRTRTLPVSKPLADGGAVEIFDKVWNAFDREYAMFVVKPKVDWAKLRDEFRPRAAAAKDNRTLATTIAGMLDRLEDLHVFVQVDGQYVPGFNRERPLNASLPALRKEFELRDAGRDIDWARTEDGIGYISIDGLRDDKLPHQFEEVLQQMKDTRGLILDLRFNGGGGEPLAQQIAGYFVDEEHVYALSQYRDGPQHDDLTEKYPRTIKPNATWYYTGPVVALQGQKTMSSAEAFALMLGRCPHVTTMGDRTAGSSGNPRQVDAGAGIMVNLPRWLAMDAEGKPFDTVGVAPDVEIKADATDFAGTNDPVLAAALRKLRESSKPDGPVLNRR